MLKTVFKTTNCWG